MPRRAFTLVELLAVMGVIFMLIGLLMPAIQKVRAAADRLRCASQLHQLGIALHLYHNDYGVLPSGVTPNRPGVPYPSLGWQARLLPYLEQESAWRQIEQAYRQDRLPFNNPPHEYFSRPMRLFGCPADERVHEPQYARGRYFVALTSYVGVLGSSWDKPDGCLYLNSRVKLTDIHDGTSNTIVVGERPPSPDFWYGWWYASVGVAGTGSPDLLLGGKENNPFGSYIPGCPLGPYVFAKGKVDNMCDTFHFWSLHPSGAHFLLADGSAQFLNYGAAPLIPALCTRSGGEVVEWP
ncbi:MAG TPA: DUF1559 domain-containing protein [Gemmatales bacterium]|nr:DUF1559 domain-containing protein [Gemmatales bacterium]